MNKRLNEDAYCSDSIMFLNALLWEDRCLNKVTF